MRQAKQKRTLDQVIAALRQSMGVVSYAATALGVSRQALHKRISNTPKLAQALHDIRQETIDECENTLFQAAKEGNLTAAIFLIKCLGKDRGYVERTEMTGKDGEAIEMRQIAAPPETTYAEWLAAVETRRAADAAEVEERAAG